MQLARSLARYTSAQNLYSSSSSSNRTLNIVSSCDENQVDGNIAKLSGCSSKHISGTLKGYSVFVGSDQLVYEMGDDEDHDSRLTQTTSSSTININYQGGGERGGASSKDHLKEEEGQSDNDQEEEEEGGWLQLSIGGHRSSMNKAKPAATATSPAMDVKLQDQLGVRATASVDANNYYPPQEENMTMSFAPPVFQFQYYHPRPHLQQHSTAAVDTNYWLPPPTTGYIPPLRSTAAHDAGPSFDFRVIDPPRRPHSGLWFMLQASQFQAKEPFLPQIPKSYLRIRDGRMTVGLVMKYLVNKLRLDSESEIEIRCRGEQLVPLLTLQDVRDNVWNNNKTNSGGAGAGAGAGAGGGGRFITSPASTSAHHLMLLHYGWNTSN